MKRLLYVLPFLMMACGTPKPATMVKSDMRDKDEVFVDDLMAKLTLADKVGEMTQLSIDVLCVGSPYNLDKPHTFDEAKLQNILVDLKVGSILNCGGHAYPREKWHDIISTIQDYAVNKKDQLQSATSHKDFAILEKYF